jgi:hypothetical protein
MIALPNKTAAKSFNLEYLFNNSQLLTNDDLFKKKNKSSNT